MHSVFHLVHLTVILTTGSCADANYSECCTHGQCAGYPATCFCDDNCYDRGDCCSDVDVTCSEGWLMHETSVVKLHRLPSTSSASKDSSRCESS